MPCSLQTVIFNSVLSRHVLPDTLHRWVHYYFRGGGLFFVFFLHYKFEETMSCGEKWNQLKTALIRDIFTICQTFHKSNFDWMQPLHDIMPSVWQAPVLLVEKTGFIKKLETFSFHFHIFNINCIIFNQQFICRCINNYSGQSTDYSHINVEWK